VSAAILDHRLSEPTLTTKKLCDSEHVTTVASTKSHCTKSHQREVAHLHADGERRADEENRSMSDQCPTSSGRFRCSRPAGHEGECVTREPARPWVGPARSETYVGHAVARAEAAHRRHMSTPSTPTEGTPDV
jgi:hypothetical protein